MCVLDLSASSTTRELEDLTRTGHLADSLDEYLAFLTAQQPPKLLPPCQQCGADSIQEIEAVLRRRMRPRHESITRGRNGSFSLFGISSRVFANDIG